MIINREEITTDDDGRLLIGIEPSLADGLKEYCTDMLSAQLDGIYRMGGVSRELLDTIHKDTVLLLHLGLSLGENEKIMELARAYTDILSQFARNARSEDSIKECLQMALEIGLVTGDRGGAL